MVTAAIVLAVVIAAILAVTAIPWRLELAAEARGEADGAWALAGGARLFALSASFARARGTPFVIEVRALRWLLMRRLLPSPGAAPPPAPDEPSLRARYDALARWVDPIDLLLFLVGETERVAIRDLEGTVRFGLADVALAGRIAGALAVISAIGSPFGRLRHEVDWSGAEHLDASFSLTFRFTPALIAWDTARFAVRSFQARRRARSRRALDVPPRAALTLPPV